MLNCNKRDQKKSIYDLAEVALFSDVSFIFLVFLKLKLWGGGGFSFILNKMTIDPRMLIPYTKPRIELSVLCIFISVTM